MPGMVIDFEGIDGSGKRTQAENLRNSFRSDVYKVVLYSYPDYNSSYGKLIKDFLDNKINLNPDEQFLLYLIDIIKDREDIRKKINEGYMVILDRYIPSTIAYQCANNFDYQKAKDMIRLVDVTLPNIIVYLDTPVKTSGERKIKQKNHKDRFEGDAALLKKVKDYYERMIEESFPSRWLRVNGTKEIKEISEEIYQTINNFMERRE
ncbi:MAG: dTMP kinase [Archaeoglobaceae archaeon]